MAENVENITNEGAEKAPEKTQETMKYEPPKLSWWDKHGADDDVHIGEFLLDVVPA